MPLSRPLLLSVGLLLLGSPARAGGGGGGGGGGGPGPAFEERALPATPPGEAGDELCASAGTPPGPAGAARAKALLEKDASGEKDPRSVEREFCLVREKAVAYSAWASAFADKNARELCGATPEVLAKWKHWAGEAAHLKEILRKFLPYGMAALDAQDDASRPALSALEEAESGGRLAFAKIALTADQCAYGQARLDEARAAKTLADVNQRFGKRAEPGALDKAFDNAKSRADGNLVAGGLPSRPKDRLAPPAPGGKTPPTTRTPPPESFESLTAGIVLESGAEKISARERRRRQEVFDGALRHIYSIPEGKKVLRDIQEVRRLKGEELAKERPHIEAEAAARRKYLDTLIRAQTALEAEPAPAAPNARIVAPNSADDGELDRVEPYKTLKRCPEGQSAVRVDFPNAGDRGCRPEKSAPGLYLSKKKKDGEYDLGETAERCPDGQTPVLTNHPHPGDRACRPPDDPEMVKSIGPGPYYYVATDDPFQPYKIFDKCPNRSTPVISNWPKPGDISCMGPGSFGSSAEVKAKVAKQKKVVEVDRVWLTATNRDALPRVGVSFGGTGPLEGGHARPVLYRLMAYEDGSASFTTPIEISTNYLKDGNPSRAVDKILVHELRHTADRAMFEAANASETRWMIGEDRAYLSESRAVMEQQPALRRERRSGVIENMKAGLVEPTLRDPKSVRIERLSSPLYLWHVTHADLNAPRSGLDGRLDMLYAMLSGAGKREREDIFNEVDPSGDMRRAYQAAMDAELKDPSSRDDRRRALFLERASATRAAQRWIDGVERLKNAESAPGAAPAWKERFDRMEREYWRDLEDFSARYARK